MNVNPSSLSNQPKEISASIAQEKIDSGKYHRVKNSKGGEERLREKTSSYSFRVFKAALATVGTLGFIALSKNGRKLFRERQDYIIKPDEPILSTKTISTDVKNSARELRPKQVLAPSTAIPRTAPQSPIPLPNVAQENLEAKAPIQPEASSVKEMPILKLPESPFSGFEGRPFDTISLFQGQWSQTIKLDESETTFTFTADPKKQEVTVRAPKNAELAFNFHGSDAIFYSSPDTAWEHKIPFSDFLSGPPCLNVYKINDDNKWVPHQMAAISLNPFNIEDFTPPPINENLFQNHKWFEKGFGNLNLYPFHTSFESNKTKVNFELNPFTGQVTVEIPKTPRPFCLKIDGSQIFSSKDEIVKYQFFPDKNKTEVYSYEINANLEWQPVGKRDIYHDKLTTPLKNSYESSVESVNGNQNLQKSFSKLDLWKGHGNYIKESPGLSSSKSDFNSTQLVQDLKVVALASVESPDSHARSLEKESQARLNSKEANLNCWQFCMQAYVEEGLLNLPDVGRIYQFESANPNFRIPDALHYDKAAYAISNEERDNTLKTASKGDLISFSSQLDTIWHCSLFLDYNPETQEVSYMEMLNDSAKITKKTLDDLSQMIILTKSADIQPNIEKFLESKQQNLGVSPNN